jgi:lysyl-tRNA synthetase class 2
MTDAALPVQLDTNQIIEERRAKLAALRTQGNPFPNDFRRQDLAADLHLAGEGKTNEELEAAPIVVRIAGRMMLKRVMGKASFATLQDMSGRVQIYVTNDVTGIETHDAFKHWDLGDFLGADGTLFRTRTGELTVKVTALRLLSKALRPLPEKFHGLTDQEQKYRQRHIDLITNPESRDVFIKRSKIVQAIREFYVGRGYLEVETPMMHPIPGGAAARPFVTHHNALDMQLYLRIAPELYLKRLVVGGFEKVFEINRNFRNEGISTRHNPEFTMLEFYEAYQDYHYLMDLTEDLLRTVADKVLGTTTVTYQGTEIDLGKPFDRLTMAQAIHQYHPQHALADLDDPAYLRRALARSTIEVFPTDGLGLLQLKLFEQSTESKLDPADVHRRAPDRRVTARPRERREPGRHRPFRALHHGPRDRERLLGTERPRRPGRALRRSGEGQGGRRRGGDVLRRGLHPGTRAGPAAHGRRRHRHRPPRDAADRQRESIRDVILFPHLRREE